MTNREPLSSLRRHIREARPDHLTIALAIGDVDGGTFSTDEGLKVGDLLRMAEAVVEAYPGEAVTVRVVQAA